MADEIGEQFATFVEKYLPTDRRSRSLPKLVCVATPCCWSSILMRYANIGQSRVGVS